MHRLAGPAALTAYATAITAANYLTAHHGMVHIGFGLVTTAGTFAVCTAHHAPPVAGCPYPRCRAARATGLAATA
ncbi:hypothetical protein ACFV1G_08150 [Streptomyces anulatus]|uniref:hypothetical protein n=1 Tax=Streptomyces anulatus TaxID=1892 RepID=UPI00369B88C0